MRITAHTRKAFVAVLSYMHSAIANESYVGRVVQVLIDSAPSILVGVLDKSAPSPLK